MRLENPGKPGQPDSQGSPRRKRVPTFAVLRIAANSDKDGKKYGRHAKTVTLSRIE